MTERSAYESRGFTVVEVLVGLALATIVAVPILTLLQSGLNGERAQTASITAMLDGANAMDRWARDARSTAEVRALPATVEATKGLSLRVLDDLGVESFVLWQIENSQLVRSVVDASGRVVSTAVVLDGLDETSGFRVMNAAGDDVDASAGSRTDLANCAATMRLELVPVGDPADARSLDVALRSSRGGSC